MKSPFLYFLASTLSRLDPIFPRSKSPDGAGVPALRGAPGHAVAGHVGAHDAAQGARPTGLGPVQYAFVMAILSGLSLPIGAMLGVKLKPHDTTIARWIAIGAGALLFAVSVELYGHSIHSFSAGHTELGPMILLLAMSLFGSYLFIYLARLYEGEDEDSEGPEEHGEQEHSARGPPSPTARNDPSARWNSLADAHAQRGRGLGALVRQVQDHRRWKAQMRWAHLRDAMKKGHIINFLQKLTQARKRTDGTASVGVRSTSLKDIQSRDFWANLKKAWGETSTSGPAEEELSEIANKSRAAAMSMLIMLIVDGIPEGILMGLMSASGSLGFTFILALVIANFPEGFAGGQLMEQAGMPYIQIILAWACPMLLTACFAGIACHMLLWLDPAYTGGHDKPYSIQILIAATEGVAGGAMISGIASTMLPEAFERRDKKGGILGSGGFLCTFGFLLSFGIKILLD